MDLITSEELEQFLSKAGKVKGSRIISQIAKLNQDLSYVLANEFGKKLMDMDIDRMEVLFPKIYNEKATPEEFAEYRYLRDIRIPTISAKIRAYLKLLASVKKVETR
jgi:hypothetical protein